MKRILLAVLTACSMIPIHAAVFEYSVSLDGPSDGNTSPGIGSGTVDYDDVLHTLQLQVNFSGLQGNTTASHIHAPTLVPGTGGAGVATTTPTFAGFPLGVTSGSYSVTLDLTQASSFNAAYVTANGGTTAGAESALAAAMTGGMAYWNIHSSSFPGGEIRGFLVAVPEPSGLALLGVGAAGMALTVWRRNRTNKS